MDNSPTMICNKTVYPTIIQNVYVSLENWDLEFHEANSRCFYAFPKSIGNSIYARSTRDVGLKLSLFFILESVVLGVGAVGLHVEKASGVFYQHRCAKMEVIVIEKHFLL